MQNLERRVLALETVSTDQGVEVVVVENGETRASALHREGIAPGTVDVVFVVFDGPEVNDSE